MQGTFHRKQRAQGQHLHTTAGSHHQFQLSSWMACAAAPHIRYMQTRDKTRKLARQLRWWWWWSTGHLPHKTLTSFWRFQRWTAQRAWMRRMWPFFAVFSVLWLLDDENPETNVNWFGQKNGKLKLSGDKWYTFPASSFSSRLHFCFFEYWFFLSLFSLFHHTRKMLIWNGKARCQLWQRPDRYDDDDGRGKLRESILICATLEGDDGGFPKWEKPWTSLAMVKVWLGFKNESEYCVRDPEQMMLDYSVASVSNRLRRNATTKQILGKNKSRQPLHYGPNRKFSEKNCFLCSVDFGSIVSSGMSS